MNSENNLNVSDDNQPQVFLRKIVFNDGTELPLSNDSIVVFTGANNCGKSQVLKDIETLLNHSNNSKSIVIADAEFDFIGSIDENGFIEKRFFKDSNGNIQLYEYPISMDKNSLYIWWNAHTLYNSLHLLFIKRLDTSSRLLASNDLIRNSNPEKHPIYKLNKNDRLSKKISDYFRQAFGVDLVINRNEMQTIPLHVGEAPDSKLYKMDDQDEYYKIISSLPKLKEQGDGMRSFASILLDTFTSVYSITLIDEPEAFLHPPQARTLGNMLAKNICNRQLFLSTHSEDFLQGLLDTNNENVTVIRINRNQDINKIHILPNSEIKKLWGNPLLRYSNILSGLFHEKVVVCESDYDCLFYQSIMFSIYEYNNENIPDILFTHCGGKSRAKDVVKALKAVNVPVVVICDFDILNSSHNLKPLTAAFGLDWDKSLKNDMNIIYDNINSKSNPKNEWERLKKVGKYGLDGNAPAAYDNIEKIFRKCGLFIVPYGEIECFDKTINKEKKEWVYTVLEEYNLASEQKLDNARQFIKDIINFKLNDV